MYIPCHSAPELFFARVLQGPLKKTVDVEPLNSLKQLGTWSRRGQPCQAEHHYWVYDEAVSCLRPPLAASVGLEAGELMRWLHLVTIGSL